MPKAVLKGRVALVTATVAPLEPRAKTPHCRHSTWFEWARRERIVIAVSGGDVYTPLEEAVAVAEMMRWYPMREYGSGFTQNLEIVEW